MLGAGGERHRWRACGRADAGTHIRHLAPQPRRIEDVRLVHDRELLGTEASAAEKGEATVSRTRARTRRKCLRRVHLRFKPKLDRVLDLLPRVGHFVLGGPPVLRGLVQAKVGASQQLSDDDNVYALANYLRLQRAEVR
jgi:hypothetical protein